MAVGGTVDAVVVEQQHVAIGVERKIEFEHIGRNRGGRAHLDQAVFRPRCVAAAAMGGDAGGIGGRAEQARLPRARRSRTKDRRSEKRGNDGQTHRSLPDPSVLCGERRQDWQCRRRIIVRPPALLLRSTES
jgi:hypothetical protein